MGSPGHIRYFWTQLGHQVALPHPPGCGFVSRGAPGPSLSSVLAPLWIEETQVYLAGIFRKATLVICGEILTLFWRTSPVRGRYTNRASNFCRTKTWAFSWPANGSYLDYRVDFHIPKPRLKWSCSHWDNHVAVQGMHSKMTYWISKNHYCHDKSHIRRMRTAVYGRFCKQEKYQYCTV